MSTSMAALLVALAAFFVGPLLVWSSRDSKRVRAGIDGLVLALVGGIGLFHLGPHAVEHGGVLALVGILVGAVVPALLHRSGHTSVWAGSALLLLATHAVIDGAALAMLDGGPSLALAVGVAAHRLPVGLGVAVAARPAKRALAILGGLALLTVLGFLGGSSVAGDHLLSHGVEAAMEGLVVGGLLHVIVAHSLVGRQRGARAHHHSHSHGHQQVHAPPPTGPCTHDHGQPHQDHSQSHSHRRQPDKPRPASRSAGVLAAITIPQSNALGMACGGLILVAMGLFATAHDTLGPLHASMRAFWSLSLTSAPALLLGFTLAGLVSGLMGHGTRLFAGRHRAGQAVRGVLFGLPLPVCSCGVVPMYQSLIQRGAPVTAGLAFLIATPELGLDALLLSVPLLGGSLTAARVVAAFVVALLVALMVGHGADKDATEPPPPPPGPLPSLRTRIAEGLRYGFIDLVDHTLPWIVFGLLLAAFLEPLLDHTVLTTVPPVLQVPLAAVIGLPLYVCASGATPLAAVAVHKGLSAGAALTFLLAGPATNITTFGVLASLHGRRLALRFGLVLTVLAMVAGWSVDWLGITVPDAGHPGDPHVHGGVAYEVVETIALAGLAVVAAASLWRQGARGAVDQILRPIPRH